MQFTGKYTRFSSTPFLEVVSRLESPGLGLGMITEANKYTLLLLRKPCYVVKSSLSNSRRYLHEYDKDFIGISQSTL